MNISHFLLLVISIGWLSVGAYADDRLHVVYSYEEEALGDILKKFGEVRGRPVRTEYLTGDQIKASLISMMELAPPDAIILPADQVGLYSYASFSEIDSRIFKANLSDRIMGCGYSDGKLYGMPIIQGNHLLLFYNKDLVKAPARDLPTLFNQQAAFESNNIATIAWLYDEPYYLLPFLGASGGWPVIGGKIHLNTPAMVEALKSYHRFHTQKMLLSKCDVNCIHSNFIAGKVAYVISGAWDVHNFSTALGDKLGISAIPMEKDKSLVAPFSTFVVAFPNNALQGPQRAMLIELVDYLQSPQVQQQLWDRLEAIPVEPGAFAYAKNNANLYMGQVLELMHNTRPVPTDPTMTMVWDAMRKGMIRYKEGVLDAKGAAQYMQTLAERHLGHINQQPSLPPPTQGSSSASH